MSFYVYLLQCSDQSFYIGHTDNLEARLALHQRGELKGCYTKSRLPVVLLKAEMFESREEAMSAEMQMKGWTRAKKLAWVSGITKKSVVWERRNSNEVCYQSRQACSSFDTPAKRCRLLRTNGLVVICGLFFLGGRFTTHPFVLSSPQGVSKGVSKGQET